MVDTMLPYTQQDSYDRNRVLRTFKAIILENEHLKATFIPELGGRLWSLWDKDSARELLYCNPVFQPGNLALRNAWFSGGVEFNVSIKGHHPMTCSDMFAQHITMADGTPGVRMYEYERIRGTAYGFDAWLPDGSKLLFIRPRIENNTDHDVWTYWWSNIAVSYTDGMRVIVPADKTFVNYADDNHYYLDFADVPVANGVDISYPKNVKIAQDFFYIPDCAPKWIAAVDEHGVGMMQCSTRNLLGRKLFVWGDSHGGDNWKNFLSDGTNNGYVEIQAGLARTQLEHIPLEEGCVYTWAEAYGALEKPAEKLHGDWQTAQDTVVEAMEEAFDHNIDNVLNSMKIISATAGEMIHMGSGWGCLEQLRRKADGEHKPLSYWYDFPESTITGAQMPWYNLLRCGRLDSADPLAVPDGYLVDNKWLLRMEKAMERPENQSWFGWMHLGLMRYANGDVRGAMWAFDSSLALEPSPWVLRNLAMIHGNEYDNFKKAKEYMERSVQMEPNNRWLWIDMAVLCLKAGLYQYWVDLYFTIPENIRAEGRLKVYTAIALTHLGQLDEACAYLNHDLLVPDIKEDENLITEAWFALYGAIIAKKTGINNPDQLRKMVESEYPLGELDFRMH